MFGNKEFKIVKKQSVRSLMINRFVVPFLTALLIITNIPVNIDASEYQTLSFSGEKYKVVLTYDENSAIPEGSVLHVEEYENDVDEYDEYVEKTQSILEWEDNDFSIYSFLNIYILDSNGEIVIPQNKVKIKVQLVQENKDDEDLSIDDTQLVMINEENNGVVINGKDEDAVADEDSNITVDFTENSEDNSFPVVAVAQTVKEKVIKTSDNKTYSVKVVYGPEAGIPLDAQIDVTEVDFYDYVDQSTEKLDITEDKIAFAYAFDIRIIDPETGREYQPNDYVKISISLLKEEIDDDSNINVLHIHDNEVAELIDSNIKDESVEFKTDGFSVYVVVSTYAEQILKATDGNTYKISVLYDETSGIPENAELLVTEITEGDDKYEEYISQTVDELEVSKGELSFIKAFDITLKDTVTGEEFQPNKDVKVSVELLDTEINEDTEINVVHFAKDIEVLDNKTVNNAVEFNTGSFSVYVITGSDVYRRTYNFYFWSDNTYKPYIFTTDTGDRTSSQTVKKGEKPYIPQPAADPQGRPFAGWYAYQEGTTVFENEPYDFDKPITQDEVVDLYAVFKDQAAVIFHDQYSEDLQSFPIADTRLGIPDDNTGKATIKVTDLSTTYNGGNDMAFYGWSATPIKQPGSAVDDYGDPVKAVTVDGNGCIEVAAQVTHLYPIFKSIKWLSFWSGPTGSGATYYPAKYYYDGVGPEVLGVPEREGYTFLGWYAGYIDSSGEVQYGSVAISDADGNLINGASDGNVSVYGGHLHLSDNATLFAKYSDDIEYRIIIWLQKTTDEPDLDDEDKNYEYIESVTLTAAEGDTVSVPESYKQYSTGIYAKYETPARCDDEKVINGGGVVLNVYYDVAFPYVASGNSHTLTFADSVAGGTDDLPPSQNYNYNDLIVVPDDPEPARLHYSFSGWYADPSCTIRVDLSKMAMPDHDVTVYAGWEAEWFLVKIDPNYGALYAYDENHVLEGTGSTWFWEDYSGQPIQEYQHVTRDYVESSSGTYYYVNHNRAYYGYSDEYVSGENGERKTYYTQDPSEATEYTTYEYVPNVYRYAGWYEVNKDGSETPYEFGKKVDHDISLKLHWKKVGTYYLKYSAGEGRFDSEGTTEITDPGVYADNALIVIEQSAIAPEDKTFVGWKIQGDDSGAVYSIGQSFNLKSDFAVSISGKETVILEAVYIKLGTAKIVYDFNGATLPEGATFDFGRQSDPHDVEGDVAVDRKTATVSNIVNNSNFVLSNGENLAMNNAELAGWSSNSVYDPSKDVLYELGGTYGVDTEEPITLYAVWKTDVTYHLNKDGAEWGESEDWEGYVHDPDHNTYSKSVYIGNPVSEPKGIPTYSDTVIFRYWTASSEGTAAYDFSESVEGKLDLYAYWSEPIEVSVHVVDASAENLTEITTWTTNPIQVGIEQIDLPGTNYVTVPDGSDYEYAFVVAHSRTASLQNISEDEKVKAIYYNQTAKHLYVKYEDTSKEDAVLDETFDIFFVYYQKKQRNILYKKMLTSGELTPVTPAGAPTQTDIKLGTYDVAYNINQPLAWLADSDYQYFAYAIGENSATNASGLSLITNASSSDSSRPSLEVKNTWRGFSYSTDNGSTWTNCGYDPTFFVVYFEQNPTVVMFHEKTVGTNAVMEKDFIFDLVITQTTEKTTSEYMQENNGEEWEDVGEPTVTSNTEEETIFGPGSADYSQYKLKNGEANSAILFYSDTDNQSFEEIDETHRKRIVVNTVISQTASITQTADSDFTTTIKDDEQSFEPYTYTRTSTVVGGTVDAVFTNTHKKLLVEVHVARIENGTVVQHDDLRGSNYSFDLQINENANLLDTLPADGVYNDATGVYTLGAIAYGNDDGSDVNLQQLNVKSVAYEEVSDDIYEILLKDESENVICQLGDYRIYYLYYPMPKIQYVKQSGQNDNAILSLIRGSTDGENPSPVITYGTSPVIMNGQNVAQDQRIKIPFDGLTISQESSSSVFKMPPILDDEVYQRYLSYEFIGVGPGIASGSTQPISELDGNVSNELKMYIKIQDNKLIWSFDNVSWSELDETKTIYAIYTEHGYDFQVSKIINTSSSGNDPIFTDRTFKVEISSTAISKSSYNAVGYESTTISAIPASGTTPGKIEFTVRDGSKIKIVGLGRGDYRITESENENFELTAKSGPITGSATQDEEVVNNTVSMYLGTEKQLVLTNSPKAICKITDDHLFYTLSSAIDYVVNNIASLEAEIAMLTDYQMPKEDTLTIPSSANITLTTATVGTYVYDGTGKAVISRSEDLSDSALITNNGSLTLVNITIDGKSIDSSEPMIQSNGSLTVDRGTTIQNARNSGNGGAISASGNVSFISNYEVNLKNNTAYNGGLLYYSGTGTVTVSGGNITNNKATNGGGAIFAESGTLNISAGDIYQNTAENGAALYTNNGLINISSNGHIRNNTADQNGGAIYAVSGNVVISNGKIENNISTNGNGGGIYTESGTITVSNGTLSGNTASNGNGGAVFVNNGTVDVKGGTINGANNSKNGAAVFVNTGVGNFSGGDITENTATLGGAIGVGSTSARLDFSNSIKVFNNTNVTVSDGYCNVYLDLDSDSIITSSGMNGSASVGVYVPNINKDGEEYQFKTHGDIGCLFGTFNGSSATTLPFKNDRQPNLIAVVNSNTKKIFWSSPLKVEVRYLASYASSLPNGTNGDQKYTNNNYYPAVGNVAISVLADELRDKCSGLSSTAVYATALVQDVASYDNYLTRLDWADGRWIITKRDGSSEALITDEISRKIIIYYSEPAFISIENNTDYQLDISSMTINLQGQKSLINSSSTTGFGLVFAKDGAIQEELLPVQANEQGKYILSANGGSVNVLIPGGKNATFTFAGDFETTASDLIRVRMNGSEQSSVPANQTINLSDKTLNNSNTYEIIFGADKIICKIYTDAIEDTSGDRIAAQTNADSDGKVEYAFSTMNDAINFARNHDLGVLKTDPVKIEMVVDYLMPHNDVIEIGETGDIDYLALTTAKNGTYKYPGEGRATISRHSNNTQKPLVSVTGDKTISKEISIESLDFDGKALTGTCDGGALKTKNCKVTIKDSDFVNFIAQNGGAIFVSYGEEGPNGNASKYDFTGYSVDGYPNSTLIITNAKFKNCTSKTTKGRCGGGAVWSNGIRMELTDCDFETCIATDQGGAVFHRIESQNKSGYKPYPYCTNSTTIVRNSTFNSCTANAAGGIESDAHDVKVYDSDFTLCRAAARGGGGLNVYIHDSADYKDSTTYTYLENCTFNSCTAKRDGGGLNAAATETTVVNSKFYNCKAEGGVNENRGGGIYFKNKNATVARVYGCIIEGCSTKGSNPNGGGISCNAAALYVDSFVDQQTGAVKQTIIRNCSAASNGGGIHVTKGNNLAVITIKDAIIEGCTAKEGGAFYTDNAVSAEFENCTISNNTASNGNGGGIYHSISGSLTLNGTSVNGNKASNQGGGIYVKKVLNLINSIISDNQLTSNTVDNAAGVYMTDENNSVLSIGSEGSTIDNSAILDNTTKNGTSSNLRLPEKNGVNANSVSVNCNLGSINGVGGYFGVVNAKNVGTQFGKSSIPNPEGFSEQDYVFKSDSTTLHGIIDRQDDQGIKIIWAGPPICKITDKDGKLLYFKNNGTDAAIFDVLEDGVSASTDAKKNRTSAFRLLRKAPALYYAPDSEGEVGAEYKGTEFCIKMLVEEYELTNQVTTVDDNTKTITLTTAGKGDEHYPFDKSASGARATITRGENVTGSMINASTNMIFTNILLDGNNVVSNENGGILRVTGTNSIDVEITANAVLQRGKAANGGAVAVNNGNFTINGGLIRFCEATGNGGAVFTASGTGSTNFDAGNIQQCNAEDGAGVYVFDGSFNMSGGTISGCNASRSGGGVYVADGKTMNMSGGYIGYDTANTAVVSGGGIAVGGSNSRLYFTKQVNISRNTCEASKATGKLCNVELNLDTKYVINANGLFGRSYIGVYVPGNRDDDHPDNDTTPYKERGGEGDPFGSYTGTDATLYCFVNDRNGLKGGLIANSEEYTIYWIKIFSIEVGKEVQVSDNVSNAIKENAHNQEFTFTVQLWEPDDYTGNIKVANIAAEIAEAKEQGVDSKYGAIPYETVAGSPKLIKAVIHLKDGETLSSENLPAGLGYDVTEQDTSGYVSIPTNYYSGKTGENVDKAGEGINPYVSTVKYENLLGVCKITNTSGELLYEHKKINEIDYVIPAVYKELIGENGAFTVVNSGRLYPKDSTVSYSGALRVEMLVPEYTLTNGIEMKTRVTTFTTAKSDATDNFPYMGTGVATIRRSTGFANKSMIKLANNSDLTLKNIKLDGNKIAVSVNGGLVNVVSGSHLRVESGAALQNSRTTVDGAGVYVASGGHLYMSGNPTFGGTDTDAYGYLFNETGNFKVGTLTDKKNGGQNYTIAHQDIYLAEANDNNPNSIIINGKMSGTDGSIWVWADSVYHYKELKSFAKLTDVDGGNLRVFRNARPDDLVSDDEVISYFYGTNEGDKPGFVYWSGPGDYQEVILRKVNSSTVSLPGGVFSVYRGSSDNPYVAKKKIGDETVSETLSGLSSNSSGVFWIGMLPSGTYYIYESIAPSGYSADKWYCLIVDKTGVYISTRGYSGATAKDDAYGNALQVKNA